MCSCIYILLHLATSDAWSAALLQPGSPGHGHAVPSKEGDMELLCVQRHRSILELLVDAGRSVLSSLRPGRGAKIVCTYTYVCVFADMFIKFKAT